MDKTVNGKRQTPRVFVRKLKGECFQHSPADKTEKRTKNRQWETNKQTNKTCRGWPCACPDKHIIKHWKTTNTKTHGVFCENSKVNAQSALTQIKVKRANGGCLGRR